MGIVELFSTRIWHLSITRWEGLWCCEYGWMNLAMSEEWNSVTDSSVGGEYMVSGRLKALSFPLLFTFWSWSVQGLAAQEINYNMVPNLQQMNQSSPLPDFTLPNPAGKKTALKDFRGKLVMLNFWASWCVPCREEMPAMERLYQEFQNKGFVILGVNVRDKREDAFGRY